MKVVLRLVEGPEAGRIFKFKEADSFLVGRTPKAHLRFDKKADRLISRIHFLLDIRPPRCIITDLDSKNGTYVNKKRIKQVELMDGDEIRVGKTKILVSIQEVSEQKDITVRCVSCGRDVTNEVGRLSPQEAAGLVYTCNQCEKTLSTPILALGALARPSSGPHDYGCLGCHQDLSKQANADGLAVELENASYLCESCALKRTKAERDEQWIGHYFILEQVGQGGMGKVFKAVDHYTRRVCAIKMILPELIRDNYAGKVFEREIEVQSKVIHPNLVRVLGQGRHGDVPFFATEFLAGGDVKKLVVWELQSPLDPPLAVNITIQVLLGVQALHNRGFIHRDLKPANYMLDRPYTEDNFVVKIADYGLAKSFENAGHSIFQYTREGVTAGSYVFIPPEQITNYKFVKPPVDVYATGASLYFTLTTRYSVDFPKESESSSFTDPTTRQRHPLQIILEDPPVPVLERRADLPSSLAEVVDTAVAKDLKRRYKSADEFRRALEGVCKQQGWPLPSYQQNPIGPHE